MAKSRISRKRLLQGFGVAAVAGTLGIAQTRSASSDAVTKSPNPASLPDGFSYAGGKPPQVLPVKEVRGVLVSVDDATIVVEAGKTVDVISLDSKPFIWKNGIVYPERAASRLRVGEPVTIDGVTDSDGAFLDIQHVWVG